MKTRMLFLGALASIVSFLSACAVETKVQQGRMALLYGDPEVALGAFQSGAELDPDYLYFSVFPQGIWTYVGRANYAAGKYPAARQALERAVSLHQEDSMAKLYLGLTLSRSGDRQSGLKEIEGGLRGCTSGSTMSINTLHFRTDSTGTPQKKSALRSKTAFP
jgi:tetratricopeptide (TPR) repeat protein